MSLKNGRHKTKRQRRKSELLDTSKGSRIYQSIMKGFHPFSRRLRVPRIGKGESATPLSRHTSVVQRRARPLRPRKAPHEHVHGNADLCDLQATIASYDAFARNHRIVRRAKQRGYSEGGWSDHGPVAPSAAHFFPVGRIKYPSVTDSTDVSYDRDTLLGRNIYDWLLVTISDLF